MKEKIRIALLVPAIDAKGPTIFTQYLIKGLKKEAYVEVFYFKETEQIDMGVTCTKLDFFKRKNFDGFDVVHSTMAVPDLYAALYVNKKKWVSSMHNYLEVDIKMLHKQWKARIIIFLWKWALSHCRNVIVSSNAMKQYYIKLIGQKNYATISYGIDEPLYGEIEQNDFVEIERLKNKNLIIVGSVGVFVPRKGFEQLLMLAKECKDIAVVIVGSGPEYISMRKRAEELGISDRVFLPGYRTNSYNFYKYFDIYAHVSYSEGFGIAMLEALSKSLPIVCSKLDIYEEYFTEQEVAYFTPGDMNSLYSALRKAIDNKEIYQNKSFMLFKTKFELEVMCCKHRELYQKIIERERDLKDGIDIDFDANL